MYTDTNREEGRADPDRRDPVESHDSVAAFAAAIGRELDTLLAIIQMNAQVGLETGPPEMSDLFGDLMLACRRGGELSEKLSRTIACPRSERGPLDVAQFVEQLRPVLEDMLGGDIRCEISDELTHSPVVLAEAEELELLFLRIAAATRKAMPNGGELHISLEDESIGRLRLVFEAIEPTSVLASNSFFSNEPPLSVPAGVASARQLLDQWGGSASTSDGSAPSFSMVLLRVAQRTSRPPVIISSDRP